MGASSQQPSLAVQLRPAKCPAPRCRAPDCVFLTRGRRGSRTVSGAEMPRTVSLGARGGESERGRGGEGMTRKFTKDKLHMDSNQMRKCSASLVTTEKPIKEAMSFHFSL